MRLGKSNFDWKLCILFWVFFSRFWVILFLGTLALKLLINKLKLKSTCEYCIKYKIWLFSSSHCSLSISRMWKMCVCIWLVWQMKSKYCLERIHTRVQRSMLFCLFHCFLFLSFSRGYMICMCCCILLSNSMKKSVIGILQWKATFSFHFIFIFQFPSRLYYLPIYTSSYIFNESSIYWAGVPLYRLSCLLK